MGHRNRPPGSRAGFPLLTEGKLHKFCSSNPCTGLDTVGISFPIEPDFEIRGATLSVTGYDTPQQDRRWRHKLKGGGFLGLGVGDRAWLEASLPHRACDSNVIALPVPIALETLRDAYDEAASLCTARSEHTFESSKIVRADHVRDFDDVAHAATLLDGLAAVRRDDVRWKVRRWQDGERNQAETLRVGPRAWGGTMYDKHAESPEFASPGRVRTEFRLHAEQLNGVFAQNLLGPLRTLRTVRDLEQGAVDVMTRSMFERCAFDREVSAIANIAEAVQACHEISDRERAALWAYLTMPNFSSTVHRNTERKYRRIAKALGVAPGRVEMVEAEYSVRLGFDEGTEIVRKAA